jgi:hypothetical protein
MVFRGRLGSNGRGAVIGGVGVREGLSPVSDCTAECIPGSGSPMTWRLPPETDRKRSTRMWRNSSCSLDSSVCHLYVLARVMLNTEGLMTSTARNSFSIHVFPTENVPLEFILDLWMKPSPSAFRASKMNLGFMSASGPASSQILT